MLARHFVRVAQDVPGHAAGRDRAQHGVAGRAGVRRGERLRRRVRPAHPDRPAQPRQPVGARAVPARAARTLRPLAAPARLEPDLDDHRRPRRGRRRPDAGLRVLRDARTVARGGPAFVTR
jgi:hypothetical protein